MQFPQVKKVPSRLQPCKVRLSMPKLHRMKPNRGWLQQGYEILEQASSTEEADFQLNRKTPVGLSERELLASLNYLDEEALQEFEGIGPVIAKHIVAYRQSIDCFTRIDELVFVKRIGKKRFFHLVGRICKLDTHPLHTLMRIEAGQIITVEALNPWKSPAPDINSIFLRQSSQRANPTTEESQPAHIESFKIGKLHLDFHCARKPESRRAALLLRSLPKILRSINYERSITSTN